MSACPSPGRAARAATTASLELLLVEPGPPSCAASCELVTLAPRARAAACSLSHFISRAPSVPPVCLVTTVIGK